MGLIYRAISPSGKIYIGQTLKSLQERKSEHLYEFKYQKSKKRIFYKALKKYGPENFKWEIVEDDIPQQFLNIKECEYIQIFDSYKNGYNSTTGGEISPMLFIEVRKKVSESRIGKKLSEEHKQKIRMNSKKPRLGVKLSEEEKLLISKRTKEQMHKAENWDKYLFAMKNKNINGKNNPMFGKKHSEEAKEKMRRKAIERRRK